jgi:hypothetical protein
MDGPLRCTRVTKPGPRRVVLGVETEPPQLCCVARAVENDLQDRLPHMPWLNPPLNVPPRLPLPWHLWKCPVESAVGSTDSAASPVTIAAEDHVALWHQVQVGTGELASSQTVVPEALQLRHRNQRGQRGGEEPHVGHLWRLGLRRLGLPRLGLQQLGLRRLQQLWRSCPCGGWGCGGCGCLCRHVRHVRHLPLWPNLVMISIGQHWATWALTQNLYT